MIIIVNFLDYYQYNLFIKSLNMAFFGVQLNAQINRLINHVKLTLAKNNYLPNFRTLYKAFVQFDTQQSGLISLHHFEKALNQNGIFFKKFEIQAFGKAFTEQGDNKIRWFTFLTVLKEPLNGYRIRVINNIFDFLDEQKAGKIHYSELTKKFNATNILEYKLGYKSKQNIEKELLGLVSLTKDGYALKQEFFNFYNDLSVNLPSDKVFANFVASQWNYTLNQQPETPQQQIITALRVIRFKLIQMTRGTKQEFILKQIFDEFDVNKNGMLSEDQLLTMLIKLQIPTQSRMTKPLLQKLDRDKSGFVEFDEFKNFLFFDPYPI